jgi:hypothetical protein
MLTIKLNAVASKIFSGRGKKIRLEDSNGVLRAKPTDRKNSDDLVAQHIDENGIVSFVVPDRYLDDCPESIRAIKSGTMALREEKYGWVAFVPFNIAGAGASVD